MEYGSCSLTVPKRNNDDFRITASLSQKVSFDFKILIKLAGSDPDISDSIAVLTYIKEPENLKKSPIDFMLGLLDVLRLSHFATSEKTDIISKLGFMLPAQELSYYDE
jgi:hypothetical protein